MMALTTLFAIIILTLVLGNSLTLIFKKQSSDYDLRIFGLTLFLYSFFLLSHFLWFEAGYILKWPHLLRSLSPLMYLTGPLFYFFIRNAIYKTKGLRKYDYVHFLPAIIHLIDLIPFYSLPISEKLELAQEIVNDPATLYWKAEGFIPILIHYAIRKILLLSYYFYSFYILNKALDFWSVLKTEDISKNWFLMSFLLIGGVFVSHFLYDISYVLEMKQLLILPFENNIFAFFAFTFLTSLNILISFNHEFIFFNDSKYSFHVMTDITKIRNNIRLVANDNYNEVLTQDSAAEEEGYLMESDYSNYKKALEYLMVEKQIFKQKSLNLYELSELMDLSSKKVSQTISKEYGQRLNEWINSYRVEYAILRIEEGYLQNYTVESLGELSGFNSRTTFFNAFKKEKGCSPSEYWINFQHRLLIAK